MVVQYDFTESIHAKTLPVETTRQARFLLGKVVVRVIGTTVMAGRIVETEAYPPGDPAMHAYRGMTLRNRPLFMRHGHAYIYVCYGISRMLNVASEPENIGAGVLIRALEPLLGIDSMLANRPGLGLRDLARGPGRLTLALRIGLDLSTIDLCVPGPLYLSDPNDPPPDIGVSARIGLTKAADAPLRFFIRDSRFLSGPARLNRVNSTDAAG